MINNALKLLREFYGMKQNILASNLDISCSYLSEIESGKKTPSLELLDKYAKEFKISKSSLLLFSESLDGQANKKNIRFKAANKVIKIMEWIAERER